jgi:hypothetical protein
VESLFHRYTDADLEAAEQTISWEREYGSESPVETIPPGGAWRSWIAGVVIGRCHRAIGYHKSRREILHIPENLPPFTVACLLHQVRQTGQLPLD